jgi:hypothetical protein
MPKDFRRRKKPKGVPVVKPYGLDVDAGQLLEHMYHGGIVVAQKVEFQKVALHRVVLEVRGDYI